MRVVGSLARHDKVIRAYRGNKARAKANQQKWNCQFSEIIDFFVPIEECVSIKESAVLRFCPRLLALQVNETNIWVKSYFDFPFHNRVSFFFCALL